MMTKGIVYAIQWCDTRDMTADGHTKGSIDRDGILQVMAGQQTFKHEVKRYSPHREAASTWKPREWWAECAATHCE